MRSIARFLVTRCAVAFSMAGVGILASPAAAQTALSASPRFELRSFGGAFVPTGARRELLKSGVSTGAQVAMAVNRYASVVGSFAWAGSDVKNAQSDINVYQYDIGGELGVTKPLSRSLALRPFIGAGAGGRSYDFRDGKSDAQHNLAGYASTGATLQMGKFGLRLEVRDNVSSFKGLAGERADRDVSNDLSISSGFVVRF